MSKEKLTIKNILDLTTDYFKKNNIPSARLDAEILLSYVLGQPRINLIAEFNKDLAESEINKYREVVKIRSNGCPVAYITGIKEFFTYKFIVNENVLIPRPETEIIVSEALKEFSDNLLIPEDFAILDIGCGSGCIGITLAKKFNTSKVVLADISEKALEVTYENIIKHKLLNRTKIIKTDLFPIKNMNNKFDLIVSNPPYIAETEIASLAPEILKYEPKNALISGPTGIEIIRKILDDAYNYLKPKGLILIEISPFILDAVKQIMESLSDVYNNYSIINDYSGHPRVLKILK
jgi:release factor glutamine methyltransferase